MPILLLAGCGVTSSPAAFPSPTATLAISSAITPLPPTTAAPPPTPTAMPTSIPQPPTLQGADASPPEEIMEPDTLTLTIVYDNNAYDPRLRTAWGFSCLIEYQGQVILFDTGGDSPTLLANMAALGIDPGQIEAVVLSHNHGDHTGGLSAILHDGLTVFVPQPFPKRFKEAVQSCTFSSATLVSLRTRRPTSLSTATTGQPVPAKRSSSRDRTTNPKDETKRNSTSRGGFRVLPLLWISVLYW